MLKIEADTGKLDAKLQQSEAAVKRLDAAVKVGDRTMKANVTTEEQLAKALERFEGAAIKATEAGKRKAAASLAAQKSAALYAQGLAKEREALAAVAAEERRAASLAKQKSRAIEEQLRAQERLTASNKKAAAAEAEKRVAMGAGWADAARRAAGEAEEANFKRSQKRMAALQMAQEAQNGAWKRGAGAAAGMISGIVGVGSAAGLAALALREMAGVGERAMDMARRSDDTARGLKEFIALQAEGEEGKAHVKATVLKGAAAGVKAEEAAGMAQPIQSVVDSDGDGKLNAEEKAKFDEDYEAALRLRQIGVEAKDASTVITGNRTKGIGGTAAADKLIAAADKSVGGPADFARAASAINQFEDSDTGLAAATALTAEGTSLEQLPTLVRGAALTLGSANDDSEFSKKFGLKGLSEAEKVAKLREEGDRRGKGATRDERIADFSRSFKSKEGGSLDEEKARAMGLLVRQGELFESTREAVGGEKVAGLAEGKVKTLKEDALTGSAMVADEAAAMSSANDLYGDKAPEARARKARALETGARLLEDGGDQAVDPATGEAKSLWTYDGWSGRFEAQRQRIAKGEDANIRSFFTGSTGKEGGGGAGGDGGAAVKAMADLKAALERNTAATEANSSSAKVKTPVGGAASNAEEKY